MKYHNFLVFYIISIILDNFMPLCCMECQNYSNNILNYEALLQLYDKNTKTLNLENLQLDDAIFKDGKVENAIINFVEKNQVEIISIHNNKKLTEVPEFFFFMPNLQEIFFKTSLPSKNYKSTGYKIIKNYLNNKGNIYHQIKGKITDVLMHDKCIIRVIKVDKIITRVIIDPKEPPQKWCLIL